MRKELRYSLRIWRDGDRPGGWRASLRNVRSGEVVSFADLRALADHLDRFTQEEDAAEHGRAP